MIVLLGVAGAVVLVAAVVGILYFAGNRGRQADVATQQAATKGHQQSAPHEPARSQGQGDV